MEGRKATGAVQEHNWGLMSVVVHQGGLLMALNTGVVVRLYMRKMNEAIVCMPD